MVSPRFVHAHATASVAVLGNDALARELSLPLASDAETCDFVLAQTDLHLELRDLRDPRLNPLCVDFSDVDLRPYAASLSRRQPLARAIGKAQIVVDATAGLAQDALRLALMGFRVTAIERSRVVAALVADGLKRLGARHALHDRLRLLPGDARELLPALTPRPEVVYLDPMFPEKRRSSAAVRKELKWLRDLVGDDTDALELFEAAHRVASYRVVVKRPDHAPPLVPNPAASIAGKLVRYDIYSTRI
jgi:16S rRNA (guanine1516-N2)-methyltransferase